MNTIKKNFDFQSGTGRFFTDISIEPPPALKRALIPGRLGHFLIASLEFPINQEDESKLVVLEIWCIFTANGQKRIPTVYSR